MADPDGRYFLPASPGGPRPAPGHGPFGELVRSGAGLFLGTTGWRLLSDWPDIRKAVIVAAPHTSNWDGLFMLAAAGSWRVKLRFMGKRSLTEGPFGWFMRWAGCVPVDRAAPQGMVGQMVDAFAAAPDMLLVIPPEGTRGRVDAWKRGFWHIAREAGVPLLLAVMDFQKRTVALAGPVPLTGDWDTDIAVIARHYDGVSARFPRNFAPPA